MCVSILALVNRHANCLFSMPYYIGICSTYGSTTLLILFQKRHDLRKILLHTECVFRFCLQLWYKASQILRKIQRHIIINVRKFSRKLSVILVKNFNETYIFAADFGWNLIYIKLRENPSSRRVWFHAGRYTEGQAWRRWQSLFSKFC